MKQPLIHGFLFTLLVIPWGGGLTTPLRVSSAAPPEFIHSTSNISDLTSSHQTDNNTPKSDQESISPDTQIPEWVPVEAVAKDTVSPDSLAPPKEEGVDTTVSYWADDIDFDVQKRITTLTGHARIQYKSMSLEAGWITVDWNRDLMLAGGIQDTIYTDTTKTTIDTIVWVGQPIYTDGGEVMEGDHILYNYKTKKGRVLKGKTQYLDGYYWGERIKRVEENTFFVGSGKFTTCDENEPHYHFRTRNMKMIVNDKVVARPIVMYFGEVPVGIIPYGIFPNKRGRHSGMLIPYYGETASQGRFLKDVGYYFALSDYYDLIASIDYYERYGFLGRGEFRYRVRYLLDGSIRGSFVRRNFETRKERRWALKADHNQTIDPWTQFHMNLELISDNDYYTETSTNLYDQLDKTIYSNATLTHSWPGTPSSISLNLHHQQNLETNTFSQTMPRILYRHSQTRIFSPPADIPEETKFYHNLFWSYNAEGLNKRQATNTTGDRWRGGVRHTLNFNSPQNALRYLTITPTIHLTEDWFAEWVDYRWENNALVPETKDEFRQRFLFSLGVNTKTTLYGIFLNPLGVGADFRHMMTPVVSYTYRPDFSEPKWGYYGSLQIPDSTEYTWDEFYGSVLGNTSSIEQQTLGLSLNNFFQYKRTTEDQVIRRDLFTLSLSTSHNFAAQEFPWSNLLSSFRSSPVAGGGFGPLKSLSIDLSFQHSPYQQVGDQRIEKFVWEDFSWSNPELLRLVQSSATIGLRFSGGGQRQTTFQPEMAGMIWQQPEELTYQESPEEIPSLPLPTTPTWDLFRIPWDLTLSTYYSANQSTGTKYVRLSGSIDIDLTEKWRISYSSQLDVEEGDIVSSTLTIYRDLHCWEGRFIWNPTGLGKGYFLRLSVKSPQLQDIKLERQRGPRTFSVL